MNRLFKIRIGRKHYLKTRDEIKEDIRNALEMENGDVLSEEKLENFTEIAIFLLSGENE